MKQWSVFALFALLCACTDPGDDEVDTSMHGDPPSVVFARCLQLIGHWADSTSDDLNTSFEQWRSRNDSSLIGFGYAMSKGDTVFIEDLRLERRGDDVIYSARIDSQNGGAWIPFTATLSGPDSLVFDNVGHDWPQRIAYHKEGDSGWRVSVSGTEHGLVRTEGFQFSRIAME